MEPRTRPTGITILAVLSAIGGVLGLLGGIALLGFGGLVAGGGGGGLGGLIAVFGLLAIVQAVLALAFAYGAWTLKPWAWILGVISAGLSLVIAAVNVVNGSDISSQVISIAIALVILYYLWTPNVKAAFGRA